ncbi:MAG: hypothetical protein ACRC62_31355 [Microcoleus sp.]
MVVGNYNCQLSTINRSRAPDARTTTINRSRAGTLALQLSIDRERGRSHYNDRLSTLNSQLLSDKMLPQ